MRPLNKDELAIIAKKEKRMGKDLEVVAIEYKKLFPRSTLCILSTEHMHDVRIDELSFGISMRGRKDPDIPSIGKVQSFIRALNAL